MRFEGELNILGLTANSVKYPFESIYGKNDDDVKSIIIKKYRALALKYHPDKNFGKPDAEQAAETFKAISNAFTKIEEVEFRGLLGSIFPRPHPNSHFNPTLSEKERIINQVINRPEKFYTIPEQYRKDIEVLRALFSSDKPKTIYDAYARLLYKSHIMPTDTPIREILANKTTLLDCLGQTQYPEVFFIHLNELLKNDYDAVIATITNRPHNLRLVPVTFRNDISVLQKSSSKISPYQSIVDAYITLLKSNLIYITEVPKEIFDDKQLILYGINTSSMDLNTIPQQYMDDTEILIALAKNTNKFHVSKELIDKTTFLTFWFLELNYPFETLEEFKYASLLMGKHIDKDEIPKQIFENQSFVWNLLKFNKISPQNLSLSRFASSKEIFLGVLKKLKENNNFLSISIRNHSLESFIERFVPTSFMKDSDFALKLLDIESRIFKGLPKVLTDDKDFLLKANENSLVSEHIASLILSTNEIQFSASMSKFRSFWNYYHPSLTNLEYQALVATKLEPNNVTAIIKNYRTCPALLSLVSHNLRSDNIFIAYLAKTDSSAYKFALIKVDDKWKNAYQEMLAQLEMKNQKFKTDAKNKSLKNPYEELLNGFLRIKFNENQCIHFLNALQTLNSNINIIKENRATFSKDSSFSNTILEFINRYLLPAINLFLPKSCKINRINTGLGNELRWYRDNIRQTMFSPALAERSEDLEEGPRIYYGDAYLGTTNQN